ncbi:unnamed protein product [Anisakis simplex]|uniref:UGGT thioredoxin-like domain-containing protein n=1 Tax=Anisakis simplex TaxID=6269 RepID=A0A3P6U809_ANISI|nr:unnamed protein product [Anisakis simplex]
MLKYASTFYSHGIPLRLGVVFVVNDDKSISGFQDASVAMLNYYNFVWDDVEGDGFLTPKTVINHFLEKYPDQDSNDVFNEDSDYDQGRSVGLSFLKSSGLGAAPKVLLNGVVLDDAAISPLHFEETVVSEVMKATPKLQRAIMSGKLKEKDNVMNWILSQMSMKSVRLAMLWITFTCKCDFTGSGNE